MIRSIWNAHSTKIATFVLPGQILIHLLPGSTLLKVIRTVQNSVIFSAAMNYGYRRGEMIACAISLITVEPIVWKSLYNSNEITSDLIQLIHIIGYTGSFLGGLYVHDLIRS